eukprot:COSAG02_NODE_5692_length_4119_cov_2.601244_5_plen_336_part_00
MFPDGGGWAHYTSKDLIHWRTDHPTTNFNGNTGALTVTPNGTFALWPTKHNEGCGHGNQPGDNVSVPGICMAISSGDAALETFRHRGIVGVPPSGTTIQDFRDPGRALNLKSGWYVPAGVDVPKGSNVSGCSDESVGDSSSGAGKCGGINWFRAYDDTMAQLKHTGFLLTSRRITMMECPDVFALDGKVVILVGAGGYTQYWVGSISDNDLNFVQDYSAKLDYGATSISSIYAAKTGTEALPPYTRRVAFGFSGWGNGEVTGCASWYVLPRELSISNVGKLQQHPVRELIGLRKHPQTWGLSTSGGDVAIATSSQVEVLVKCKIPNKVRLTNIVM